MGPSTILHLEALISQKDEEIRTLDTRCSTYLAKISFLQNRLQRTLDTLDEVQNKHTQETLTLTATIKTLKERLRRCSEIADSAELERDDMRDAVLRLVEKVEASNDYSRWPHSQMCISSLSDMLPHNAVNDSIALEERGDEALTYATSLIEELRRERDAERASHARTRVTSESRILNLEARLSRREAELEQYSGHAEEDVTYTPTSFNKNKTLRNEPITSEQIISMLDVTVARNKILELEIKVLMQRLEKARPALSSSLPSDITAPAGASKVTTARTSGFFVKIPPQNDPLHETSSQEHPKTDTDYSLNVDRSTLQDLEYQIHELGRKIDAFRDERKIILQKLSGTFHDERNTKAASSRDGDIHDRLAFLETEYERLRLTEDDLRHQLNTRQAEFELREEHLNDEINALQQNLHATVAHKHNQDETGSVSDLLDSTDGELSMELATPLMPTSSISVHPTSPPAQFSLSPPDERGQLGHDVYQHVDPLSIPLPPSSPDSPSNRIFPPPLNPAPILSPLSQPEVLRDGLRHLEIELVHTRRELDAGESALDHLEELINELHP